MEIIEIVFPEALVAPRRLRPSASKLEPPAPGQVQIGVEAAGVSFDDMLMRRGTFPGQPRFPFVPGRDVAGTVVREGPGVTGWAGRRVAAIVEHGGWATGVNVPAAAVVPVPDGLTFVEAVSLGYAAALARRMVHDLAGVGAGQTVVVPGAPGWVGTSLVQLAGLAGARVVGVSSTRQLAECADLEFEPVDHWTEDVPARVAAYAPDGVDAVFDTIGGPNLAESLSMLKPGGVLVSYGNWATRDQPRGTHLADLERLADPRVVPASTGLGPDDLARVFALAAEGRLRPFVAGPYAFGEAGRALEDFENGGLVGRVVLHRDSSDHP
ncbi:zinc-binding alcohol dehydrogenase family protein [Nonomuraea sp. NPDC050451]|uniref:zinc-binding alcohol dehydrogenase family protein n=1 Tax=Nonomuraea sp. NPDC050451 TaxID=3364364 RepID=UPI003788C7E8